MLAFFSTSRVRVAIDTTRDSGAAPSPMILSSGIRFGWISYELSFAGLTQVVSTVTTSVIRLRVPSRLRPRVPFRGQPFVRAADASFAWVFELSAVKRSFAREVRSRRSHCEMPNHTIRTSRRFTRFAKLRGRVSSLSRSESP
jgi:hypothetical protein